MERHSSVGRPLARLVARAAADSRPGPGAAHGPYAPPSPPDERPRARPDVELAEQLLRSLLLGGDGADELAAALDPEVVAWTPELYTTSRAELLAARHGDAGERDSLGDVDLSIVAASMVDDRMYVEWRLVGRFTNPCFIDDDVLVEPTGRPVETAGVLVLVFAAGRIRELRCYFDDFALLEQLVTAA